jgi:UPF0755 protein
VIPALPPGPIGNPGRAALEAVINPSQTKELYFVADGTGGHVFAETYEQHQRNVSRWRQIETDRKDPAQAVAAPATPAATVTVKPPAVPSPAIPAPAAPATTTSTLTVTPAQSSAPAPAAVSAQAAPAPASGPAAVASPVPAEAPPTFVPPAQVPLPPLPPAGLREGGSSPAQNGNGQNFDLSTSKTIPKLN